MALDWLIPSADGTTGSWTTTPLFSKVDDYSTTTGAFTDDSAQITSPNNASGSCFVGLDGTPAAFTAEVTLIRVKIRKSENHAGVSGTQDSSDLFVQLFRSDETTVMSTEVQVGSGTVTDGFVTLVLSGTHTKAQWDAARLRLRHVYTAQGCSDTTTSTSVQAVAVELTWTALEERPVFSLDYPARVDRAFVSANIGRKYIFQPPPPATPADGGLPSDDGAIDRLELLQYQAITGPVVVPATSTTPTDWRIGAPDLVRLPARATLHQKTAPVWTGSQSVQAIAEATAPAWIARRLPTPAPVTQTWVDSQPLDTRVGWRGAYPDRFPDRVLPTAAQLPAAAPITAVIPIPAPSLFYPDVPDWLPPKPRTHTPPTQSWVDSQAAETRQAWRSVHPDQIDRPTLRPAAQLARPALDTITGIERAAWSAVFPDRFRILPALSAALQTVGPPLFTAPLTATPTYRAPTAPDWIARRPTAQEAITRTLVDSQVTDTRTWRPTYPDLLRLVRTPTGRTVAPVAPVATSPPPGLVTYPDWLAPRSPAAALASTGATDFRSPLLTPLGWHPAYPARIVRSWMPVAQQQATGRPIDIVFIAPTPTRAWSPDFPAFIVRKQTHASGMPFFTAGTSLQIIGAVTFSYPDEVPGRPGMHAARQQAWAAGSQLVLTATPLVAPTFPAQLPRLPWRPNILTPGSLGTFPSVVPFFGWRGRYPDQIARQTLHPAAQQAFALGNQATKAVVGLAWQGRYPDRIPPAARLAWHLPGWVNLDPLPNAPSPTLAWQGWYPAVTRRTETLRAALQAAVTADTTLRPESPLGAWGPTFPDRIDRLRLAAAALPFQFVQITFAAPDPGAWWQGTAPAWLPATRRPMPPSVPTLDRTGAVSPFVAPSAPDQIARAALPVRGDRLDPPQVLQTHGTILPTTTAPSLLPRPGLIQLPGVQLVIPILSPICVCLDREAFLAATFVDEIVTGPTFDDETWIATGFVEDGPGCGTTGPGIPSTGSVGGSLGGSSPPPVTLPPPAPPPTDPGGAGSGVPIPVDPPVAVLTLATLSVQEEAVVPENRAVTTAAGLTQALADAATGVLPAGSIITLAPGTYDGHWMLPVHPGTARITITTAGTLPDRRITPADLPQLAVLRSTIAGVPPLDTADGAADWRCVGLGVTQIGGNTYDLVRLGHGGPGEQTTVAQIPTRLEFDRCYLFVGDGVEQRRGFGLNSASTVLRRCTVENIKDVDGDSVAAGGWNGPGPFLIDDCFLESCSETVLFGGAVPQVPTLTPSDITITNCTITKRRAWQGVRPVKNLIELKHARRVRIAHNDLAGCWLSGQDGFALVLTVAPRSTPSDPQVPWTTVADVLIENNTIRDVGSGVDLSGIDPANACVRMARITIRNNTIRTDIARNGGDGFGIQVLHSPSDLVVDQNTFLNEGTFLAMSNWDLLAPGFRARNNIGQAGLYGIISDGHLGTDGLAYYFADWVFSGNVLAGLPDVGQNPNDFPPGNTYPTLAALHAAFTDYPTDLTLRAGSPYTGAGAQPVDVLSGSVVTVSTLGTLGALVTGTLDWGDGSTPLGWAGAPQSGYDHTYGGPGVYLVTLTVTDDQQRSAVATLAIAVS